MTRTPVREAARHTGPTAATRATATALPAQRRQAGGGRGETGPRTVRLMIIDEFAVIRDGLCAMLSMASDIEVVAVCDSGVRAVRLAAAHEVDVIISGFSLHGTSCLDLLRRLKAEDLAVEPRLIVFAQQASDEVVNKVLRAPTYGLLVRDTSAEELIAAVRAAAQGEAVVSRSVSRRLVEWFRSSGVRRANEASKAVLDTLTAREREVLRLAGQGLSPREMASALSIQEATVRTHIYRLRTKLDLRDRAQLVAFAHQAGLTTEAAWV